MMDLGKCIGSMCQLDGRGALSNLGNGLYNLADGSRQTVKGVVQGASAVAPLVEMAASGVKLAGHENLATGLNIGAGISKVAGSLVGDEVGYDELDDDFESEFNANNYSESDYEEDSYWDDEMKYDEGYESS